MAYGKPTINPVIVFYMARILLVEPDTILGKTYASALKRASYDVATVKTAQDAISYIDKHNPDCILMEIQLVNNNGIELLYELRSHSDLKSKPIIICSSVSKQDLGLTTEICDRLGVTDYCYKPSMRLETLVKMVKLAVEK